MDEAIRQFVRQRAGQRCEYCRIPQDALPWARFHIEHIRARQHGGSDDAENLALACRRCNARKGPNLSSVDPDTDELRPLFNPRADTWSEHFTLVEHRIVGLTDLGRATATLLDMNDPERVQLRAELAALDQDVV
ncbi:MAG: HNH endonuclease [Pirellulales bacterium]